MDSIERSSISIHLVSSLKNGLEDENSNIKEIWKHFKLSSQRLDEFQKYLPFNEINGKFSEKKSHDIETEDEYCRMPSISQNNLRSNFIVAQGTGTLIRELEVKKEKGGIFDRLENWKNTRKKIIFEKELSEFMEKEEFKIGIWNDSFFNVDTIDGQLHRLILTVLDAEFQNEGRLKDESDQVDLITAMVVNKVSYSPILIELIWKRLKELKESMEAKGFSNRVVKSLEAKLAHFVHEAPTVKKLAFSARSLTSNKSHIREFLPKRKNAEKRVTTEHSINSDTAQEVQQLGLLHFFELLDSLDDQLKFLIYKLLGSSQEMAQENIERLYYWTSSEGTKKIRDVIERYTRFGIITNKLYDKHWLLNKEGITFGIPKLKHGNLLKPFKKCSRLTLTTEVSKWSLIDDNSNDKLKNFISALLMSNICFEFIKSDVIKQFLKDFNGDIAELFNRSLIGNQPVENLISIDTRLKSLLQDEGTLFSEWECVFIDILSMTSSRVSELGRSYIERYFSRLLEEYGFEVEIDPAPHIEILSGPPYYVVNRKIKLWNARNVLNPSRSRVINCLWYLMPADYGSRCKQWYSALRVEGPSQLALGVQEEDFEWKWNINIILSMSTELLDMVGPTSNEDLWHPANIII